MKKIIYIKPSPLTRHFAKSYYFDDFERRGIAVEYWDVSRLYAHDVHAGEQTRPDIAVSFNCKREVRERIAAEAGKETVIVEMFTLGWDFLWLHRALTKHRCYIALFGIGHLPIPARTTSPGGMIARLCDGGGAKFLRRFLNKLVLAAMAAGMLKGFDVVFAAGRSALGKHGGESEVVGINYYDYDAYLSIRDGKDRIIEGRYAVFLDENLPYHPDWSLLNIKTVEPESYFRGINAYFDLIEKRFGVRVVIAAHPSANYAESRFAGREIIKYKTNELVRDSEFVFAHATTSISFPVLYGKPLIFLYNDQLQRLGSQSILPWIVNFSDTLGSGLCNLDSIHSVEQLSIPCVNAGKYEQYKYDYLTSPESEDKLTKEVILDFLEAAG